MFLDHPSITATSAQAEPDRTERLQRVYGHAMARAGRAGKLTVSWHAPPSRDEQGYFSRARASKAGDGTTPVEHEY